MDVKETLLLCPSTLPALSSWAINQLSPSTARQPTTFRGIKFLKMNHRHLFTNFPPTFSISVEMQTRLGTSHNQPKHESTPSTKWSYHVKIRDQARYQTMQELQMLPVSLFRDECWDCYSQLSEISVPKATNQLLIEGVLWMSLSLSSLSPFRIWHRCQTNQAIS